MLKVYTAEYLRGLFLSVRCPECRAPKGDACVTGRGDKTATHRDRVINAHEAARKTVKA